MLIIKCDFCGAVIIVAHHKVKVAKNPETEGWVEINGRKDSCTRYKKDMCPRCILKSEEDK